MPMPQITIEQQAAIWKLRGKDERTIAATAAKLEISTRTVRKYCDDRTARVLRFIFKPPVTEELNQQ